ncbi:hypothetical protein ASC70_17785 [Caulobacter sp. Root343]|nr:hypothetical protein ASC62_02515 [Caulobacter sp. Root342]KQV65561.1 hypothetical protein ASC70_17785 [Caulobacter sp. Root343]
MDKSSKQRLTGLYIVVWTVGALLAMVLARDWVVLIWPVLWIWTVFNIAQVWRGKRRNFWG